MYPSGGATQLLTTYPPPITAIVTLQKHLKDPDQQVQRPGEGRQDERHHPQGSSSLHLCLCLLSCFPQLSSFSLLHKLTPLSLPDLMTTKHRPHSGTLYNTLDINVSM